MAVKAKTSGAIPSVPELATVLKFAVSSAHTSPPPSPVDCVNVESSRWYALIHIAARLKALQSEEVLLERFRLKKRTPKRTLKNLNELLSLRRPRARDPVRMSANALTHQFQMEQTKDTLILKFPKKNA